MAINYGVNAQKRLVDEPSQKIEVNEQGGRMRVAYDEIEVSANLAIDDEIILGQIPAGAKVYDVQVNIPTAFGTTGAADIGWKASAEGGEAEDRDGFIAAQSLTSAGAARAQDGNGAGMYKKFSEAVDVMAKLTAATDGGAGKLQVAILYALD